MATSTKLDVLIIGAGQAGLALGYYLQKTPLSFQLVEGNNRIGDSWRKRYDSLVLFTPRAYSALPGLTLPGEQAGFAGKDEVADYLETYALHFKLPVITGTAIQSLEHQNNGSYLAKTTTGSNIEARAVVLATGAFQKQTIPCLANDLAERVWQFSSEEYKNSRQIRPGPVLVVGDGPTGRDIARDLYASHTVILATGHPRKLLPAHIFGKSSWWWLDKLGLLRLSGETFLGRKLKKGDAFPGRNNTLKQLKDQGVHIMPRLVSAEGNRVTFSNGKFYQITTVIWATGFRDNSDWVAISEVKDEQGNFVHRQGISPVPNLYFIGRPWQRSRSSALIMGVGRDSQYLAAHLVKNLLTLDTQNKPSGEISALV
ncbi:MAG TPA: NAD(P)/FAD-dependent oxidoreductase [Chloroflexia bacterium]|nr:NAD(P)/FAD-dependent oxidoreductase [Chloroflexia bacterium]